MSSVRQHLPADVDKWGVSLQLLMGAVVAGGVVVAGCYRWMQENVITDTDCVDAGRCVAVDRGGSFFRLFVGDRSEAERFPPFRGGRSEFSLLFHALEKPLGDIARSNLQLLFCCCRIPGVLALRLISVELSAIGVGSCGL